MATNFTLKTKKDQELDEVTMQQRYARVGATAPIEVEGVPDTVMNVLFSRKCMSWYFGGTEFAMHPTIAKEKSSLPGRGIEHFAYYPLALHPNAPKKPGEHGAMHWNVYGTYRQPDNFVPGFLKKYKSCMSYHPGRLEAFLLTHSCSAQHRSC